MSTLESWVTRILDEVYADILMGMIFVDNYVDVTDLIRQKTDNYILVCNPCLEGIEPYLPSPANDSKL
jgi:hypothetical protein